MDSENNGGRDKGRLIIVDRKRELREDLNENGASSTSLTEQDRGHQRGVRENQLSSKEGEEKSK